MAFAAAVAASLGIDVDAEFQRRRGRHDRLTFDLL